MANFIDKSVFVGDLNLPKSQYDSIDAFISVFEPISLRNLLGHDLYNLLVKNAQNEPYLSLLNGKEYQVVVNGITYTIAFPGLKKLIPYYVYCEYQRATVTSTQSVGEVKSKQENSYNASVNQKMFSAWVKFEEMCGYPGQPKTEPSAYNYLVENSSLFPTWIFTDLRGSINSHDL